MDYFSSEDAVKAIDNDQRPSDLVIKDLFELVLDRLLTPAHVKENLITSQSLDKKWQLIKLNRKIFEDDKDADEKDIEWIKNIIAEMNDTSKKNDIQVFTKLRVSLATQDRDFMDRFLELGGISAVVQAILLRVYNLPFTELDVTILYEILLCCKVIMNTALGMDAFLAVNGSIETIARCLNFDYKLMSLLALEILSVCSYYSEDSCCMVLHGLQLLARSKNEAFVFDILKDALIHGDIEIKASTALLINSMVTGVEDDDIQMHLRQDLQSIHIGETMQELTLMIEQEMTHFQG